MRFRGRDEPHDSTNGRQVGDAFRRHIFRLVRMTVCTRDALKQDSLKRNAALHTSVLPRVFESENFKRGTSRTLRSRRPRFRLQRGSFANLDHPCFLDPSPTERRDESMTDTKTDVVQTTREIERKREGNLKRQLQKVVRGREGEQDRTERRGRSLR